MSRVVVTVDHRIHVSVAQVGPEVSALLRRDFTHANPQREMLRRIGKPHWGEPKTISTYTESDGHLHLPRGGMGKLRRRLEAAGLRREVVDHRCSGDARGAEMPEHLLKLHGFQRDAVDVLVAKQCGIFRAPTGAGKTCVALATASAVQLCTLIVVYNGGLFDQWLKRIQRELGMRLADIGIIKGGTRKLRPITVAMQQTLTSRGVDEELKAYFGMVAVDETHRAAATTMFNAVDPFPARYRIGISADYRRKDKKEFITEDLFGDVIFDVPRKQLIKSGHVLDVQVRVVLTDFEAPWYGMATDDAPELEVDTVRLTGEMAVDQARNELALSCVMDEVASGQVLVLSHRREHCMVLDRSIVGCGVPTGFLIGGLDYQQEFRKSVEAVERGTIRVGVGTFQAIGQGLDLPSVQVGVCCTPIASNKQVFGQVRGRFCRTSAGKTTARLYYLYDRHVFGWRHLRNLVSWNADVVVRDTSGQWIDAKQFLRDIDMT